MRAGELRHRIRIEYKDVTQNSYNEEVITWQTVATLWAKVEPLTGGEVIVLETMTAILSHKITVRYFVNMQPTMRVVYGDRILNILSVQEDNVRRETYLMCAEVVDATPIYPLGTT